MARRPIRGIGRFRRLLKRLPDAVRGEIVVEMNVTGREIAQAVEAKAPSLTGALRRGLSYKVLPQSLRLQVGLLGTPRGRAKLFYGRIQDLGRKAQVVLVQRHRRVGGTLRTSRGRKRAEDIATTYRMRVRGMAPKRFVTGSYPDLRRVLRANLNGIFGRALSKLSGVGDE